MAHVILAVNRQEGESGRGGEEREGEGHRLHRWRRHGGGRARRTGST